jgi:hypothetical protein
LKGKTYMALASIIPLLALTTAAPAHPIGIAAFGGYSANGACDGGQTADMFGTGFGARAGYTFPFGLYAGLGATYDLGYSQTIARAATASGRLTLAGVEVGYDLRLEPLTLRPYLGVGAAFYDATQNGPAPVFVQGNGTKVAAWSGIVATCDLGDRLFAGLDLRYTGVWAGAESYDMAPGGGAPEAFGAYAEVGVRI